MSLILCTSDCLYQLDGYCSLERVGSGGSPTDTNTCMNYVPKRTDVLQNEIQGFPNIPHANQL